MDFPMGKKLLHLMVNVTPVRHRARYPTGHQDGCRVGNNLNWYKVRETCKWNTKFRSQRSNWENGPTFLDFPLFPGIGFQRDEPTKRFPFFAEPKFPEILTEWKAPVVVLVSESKALYCLFGYVQTNPDIFENAYFLHESTFFPHETSESAHQSHIVLKSLSRIV